MQVQPTGQSGNPAHVRIVEVRMTWRNVFVLIFKFTVAFLIIDAVVIGAIAAAIAAIVNS